MDIEVGDIIMEEFIMGCCCCIIPIGRTGLCAIDQLLTGALVIAPMEFIAFQIG